MREIVHIQAGQCGNQIGAKVSLFIFLFQWNEILVFFFKFGSFWCPPFSISRRRGFCCHTWFFFLVLITSLMLIYIVMSERSSDSKTEPKICKIVSVYRILCMTHSCIPFHLKLFMRVGLIIPRLNLNIVFSLLFYV